MIHDVFCYVLVVVVVMGLCSNRLLVNDLTGALMGAASLIASLTGATVRWDAVFTGCVDLL